MPSTTNLDFNLIVKTGQSLGEIRLLKAQIQDLGRTLRAAVKAGDTAGAQSISQNIGRMEAQLRGLNRTLDQTAVAGAAAGRGIALSARSFSSLHGALKALGGSFGGLKGGLAGLVSGIGAQKLGEVIGTVADNLAKVQQVASNTNLSPAEVKAYQEAMLRAGLTIDQANASLSTFSGALTDARLKAGTFGNDTKVLVQRGTDAASNGIVRLTGDTARFIQVWRGGQPLKDLSDPLTQLVSNVNDLRAGFLGARIEAAESLLALQKISKERAAGLGPLAFGPDWEKTAKGLVDNAASLKAATGAIISPEDQKRLDDYNKAWGNLQITWENLKTEVVLAAFPQINFVLKDTEGFIKDSITEWNNLSTAISRAGAAMSRGAAASAASGESIALTQQFAAGGMVRGPGSATSDSILARLSNGEFVMSAGAVQRWGAGLLASMNGGGALVPRNGRYAAGGLVAAAGGTPVHLHLGGHSFALSGNDGVVSALVTEAHRHKIRSAGTKPSWYGGAAGR